MNGECPSSEKDVACKGRFIVVEIANGTNYETALKAINKAAAKGWKLVPIDLVSQLGGILFDRYPTRLQKRKLKQ